MTINDYIVINYNIRCIYIFTIGNKYRHIITMVYELSIGR